MGYLQLLKEIQYVAAACGRLPEEIQLIGVSKTFSWDAMAPIYEEGCREFGESRIQEAYKKFENAPKDIHWHFVGTLQRNKVKKAIGKFCLIHSIDSLELAKKVSECSLEAGVKTPILLQVNVSQEKTKYGLDFKGWRKVFDEVAILPNLSIQGLMTIGPNVEDLDLIRSSFSSLRSFRDELKLRAGPKFHHLSMGMSHDYRLAIEEGATLLRIGSGVFGSRKS